MAQKQKPASKRSSKTLLPMALVGTGLILLGAVAFLLLPKSGTATPTSQNTISAPSAIPVEVASPLPDLQLKDLQGNPVALSDYSGQWLLINNWATWCPPCKAEMPVLQAYYQEHQDQNFMLIAIESGETAEEVADFVARNKLELTIWPDPDEKVYAVFHNISLPTSWLVDPRGQIRLTWTGAITREVLEKYVTPLLEE